jgi:hypothetical protein
MFVFGGAGEQRALNDLYSISLKDGTEHEWKRINASDAG